MRKIQNKVIWAVVVSEASHIFCCVLPTLFSIASLMAGIGLITAVPTFLLDMHNVMHHWEVPLLFLSGTVIFLGWAMVLFKKKVGACCHDTGCHHGSCKPRRSWADTILMIATMLFVVNVTVYFVFHRGMDAGFQHEDAAIHDHHDH